MASSVVKNEVSSGSPGRKYKGVVVKFSYENGYGFIKRFDNKRDIFFHKRNIYSKKKVFERSILVGEEVEFTLASNRSGIVADRISVMKEAPAVKQERQDLEVTVEASRVNTLWISGSAKDFRRVRRARRQAYENK